MLSKTLFTVTFGGWYQRTTLHLSEIYDLFALGRSDLNLSVDKIRQFHHSFEFTSVTREPGDLEYIRAVTRHGIEVRYYEDGLYILELRSTDIKSAQDRLLHYFEHYLNPAISYIFSLGAPTPKVLADIKTTHPTVVSANSSKPLSILKSYNFGDVYSQITSKSLSVYKTPQYIIIFSPASSAYTRELIEMQIFFREFKDHLQRYLNIHREIWEEISDIKEKGTIVGSDVEGIRSRLDSYQKTISLIKSRINQMGTYVHTRSSLAKKLKVEDDLLSIFQYKFETLTDTHSYIQEIWKMTQEYVDTAIQVVVEVKNQTTNNSINSLRLITTIGVLSGIFGYLSKDKFPEITFIGIWYFFVLLLGTWLINQLIGYFYKKAKYKLKFTANLGIKS
jgi:hypothetical protein